MSKNIQVSVIIQMIINNLKDKHLIKLSIQKMQNNFIKNKINNKAIHNKTLKITKMTISKT